MRRGAIAALPMIGRQSWRIQPQLEEQLRIAGGTLDVVLRSDLHRSTQALVGNGLGVALLPRLAVDESDPSTAVVELGPEVPPLALGLVWHRERLPAPAAEEFGEVARDVCARHAAAPEVIPAGS